MHNNLKTLLLFHPHIAVWEPVTHLLPPISVFKYDPKQVMSS